MKDYICQVGHRNTDQLNCSAREGGGYQCERTDIHEFHWISPHTYRHDRMGSGYSCADVDMVMHLEAQAALFD